MDFKSKPFVPRQQQQHNVPPQSYNVLAPTFVPNSSLSYSLSSQEMEILCDIFADMDVNYLKSTLENKGNDLQATILSLTEMLDQASSLMLDGIWKDHLEEYDDTNNEEENNNGDEEEESDSNNDKKSIQNTAAAAEFQPVFMYSSSPSPSLSSKPTVTPNTKNNSNINNTSNNFKKQPSSTSPHKSLAKSKEEPVVCKYFLAGQCYRKDCMYLHTSTVCRYWKLGSCSRGDSCIYLHAEEEEKPQKNTKTTKSINNTKPTPPPVAPKQDKEEEINNINNKINKPAPAYLKADMAANIKLKQLQTLFHHVEPGNVKSIFYNCNFQMEASTEQISKLYGKPRVVEAPAAPAKPAVYTTAPRKPKQWVETGEEVSRLYTECREEAIKHATARNTCFQFATMRYLAGDGLAAREWSKKGRYLK